MIAPQTGVLATDEPLSRLRQRIVELNEVREDIVVRALIEEARFGKQALRQAQALAMRLAQGVRQRRLGAGGIDLLLQEFTPDSREGLALLNLTEAMLRIPDTATRNRLIRDKVVGANWRSHLGRSPSVLVNAATRCLVIAQRALERPRPRLLREGAEALVRAGVGYVMRRLAKQFVTGQTIEEALAVARKQEARGYRYSYDMLGESALTRAEADAYFRSYRHAIEQIGRRAQGAGPIEGPGVSIKLTGLHPRYEWSQRERVIREMYPQLLALALEAKRWNIGLHLDQEDASRFDLTLDMLERLSCSGELVGWEGLGVSLQAYQKRGRAVIDWLVALSRQQRRRLLVRLVKGAYWDTDIKCCQDAGTDNYPVFTRKVHSDVSYIACAKALLAAPDVVFPQFATHNAFTIAAVHTLAGNADYEFQCLYGMGETAYDQIVGRDRLGRACRIYAPVGPHETLLAYLVRRLLENGTNTSFVKQITDPELSIMELTEDPVERAERTQGTTLPPVVSRGKIALGRRGFNALARVPARAGVNAMIADSSALPEQVVADAIACAFDGRGRRPPAVHLLCLNESIASRILELIEGAMRERRVGDPMDSASDIGPLADAHAKRRFDEHVSALRRQGSRVVQACFGNVPEGNFVAPTLIEIGSMETLQILVDRAEGPILHIVRWRAGELERLLHLLDQYAKPRALALYTHIDGTIESALSTSDAAAVYINQRIEAHAIEW